MRMSANIVLACAVVCVLAVPGLCWGPTGHELIARHSVELLPAEVRGFYDTNLRYVAALSSLPDDWRHTHKEEIGDQHYIDLDLLSKPPFDDLILDRAAAEDKFGKDKIKQAGTLPWAIEERFNRLVTAFKEGNATGIVVQSAVMGHYIADAHVPFHLTKDYDGVKLEQAGIHFRFEENLVVLYLKPESIKPQSPEKVDDILKSAFKWCITSFGHIDTILAAEDKAREAGPGHNWPYFNSLWRDTGPIVQGQLSGASQALAGAIIAAWEEAGKPKLSDKAAPLFWGM